MNPFFERSNFKARFYGYADKMTKFVVENQLKVKKIWEECAYPFENNQQGLSQDSVDAGWRGEFWGKLMRGSCMVYSYNEDQELYRIMEGSVRRIMDSQEESGRISTYEPEHELYGWDMWGRKYTMLGMLYFYRICKEEEQKESILNCVSKQLEYLIKHVGDKEGQIPVGDTSTAWGAINSHTILEPVMYLYKMTEKKEYLEFADMLVKNGGANNCDLIELALDETKIPCEYPVTKAYEIMSFFEGLLEYAEVTGEKRYINAVTEFVRKIMDTEITVIGSAGCNHEQFDHGKLRQSCISNTVDKMQETCVTVTWMDLCSRMLKLTDDSRYADEIEKSAYNALYGAVNTTLSHHNGGLIFDSYTPSMSGTRGNGIAGLKAVDLFSIRGCCDSIGALGIGLFPRYAVMDTEDGVTVLFYEAGEIIGYAPDGTKVKMEISTGYPVDGRIQITLFPEKECAFTIRLRNPGFSGKTNCWINGEKADVNAGYLVLKRQWHDRDQIVLDIDMDGYVISSLGDKELAAVKKGPLVLAKDRRIEEEIDLPVYFCHESNSKAIRLSVVESKTIPALLTCEYEADSGEKTILINCSDAGKTLDEKSKMAIWMKCQSNTLF